MAHLSPACFLPLKARLARCLYDGGQQPAALQLYTNILEVCLLVLILSTTARNGIHDTTTP